MQPRLTIIQKVKLLPTYPHHTWDRRDNGHHQQLIGRDDVLELLLKLLGREDSQP